MSKENNRAETNDLDLTLGETLVVSREEILKTDDLQDPSEQTMSNFLKVIANDPNIEGVAISRMRCGGIYTDWFVRDLFDKERGGKSLEVTSSSYKLLAAAAGDNTGYASFTQLGERTFDEAEEKFRANWDVVDPNDPFSFGGTHGKDLELLGIIKFE
jgi:hypothetical protein